MQRDGPRSGGAVATAGTGGATAGTTTGSAGAADLYTSVGSKATAYQDAVAAFEAAKAAKKPTKALKKKVRAAQKAHQAAVLRLTDHLRARMPPKLQLDAYLARPDVSDDDKVATIGDLAAEVARMEFLLGTLHQMGTGSKWEKGNEGVFPDVYQEAMGGGATSPWCTMFAGYAHSRIGFSSGDKGNVSMFKSGYRLRKWSRTGMGVGKKAKRISTEASVPGAAGSTGETIEGSTWKELKKALEAVDEPAERKAAAKDFFASHPQPRPGDVLVKPRGSKGGNDFSGQSHTMLVDRFDADNFAIFTVEGNAADRVTGRRIDLTDPKHVGQLAFTTRMGKEQYGSAAGTALLGMTGAAPGGLLTIAVMFSRTMLVGTMRATNQKLLTLNNEQGWLKGKDVNTSVYEWIHGTTAATGSGTIKET